MKYKLKDNQRQELFESLLFDTKEDIRKHLHDFHSNDVQLTGKERLAFLLEIGDWDIVEIANCDDCGATVELTEAVEITSGQLICSACETKRTLI